ncbi:ParB family protein [Dickeya oryzae]|uniref:ParB family protein n=2 Tax=Dickeya oryzae TaxID=1240404 RepID=A0ABS5BDV2_9GAMM|nr:ParB family protein [Dickeya oryzae]MBP2858653.1 ParB family protein [Dickeya oryzae]
MKGVKSIHSLNLADAMLQGGREPAINNGMAVLPVSEMPMLLTLDQLRPNPDNPRTSRNPRYDEIKASIRARGLDSLPKVTRDPEGAGEYIFSDGGNTRYQILCELWQETGDERFYRIHVVFKPWPGRLKCVIGHLAENEVRGDLSYIEKAVGVNNARKIWETELGRSVTLRELSDLLNQEGYPVHYSTISRMEDTIRHLYPHLPNLLDAGLPRLQVLSLLNLRSAAEKTWQMFSSAENVSPQFSFHDAFARACVSFDNLDTYSLEMFRDEFIGQLLQALPHPSLNYDRWLIELDPAEQQRRALFGDPPAFIPSVQPQETGAPNSKTEAPDSKTVKVLPPQESERQQSAGLRSGTLIQNTPPEPAPSASGVVIQEEEQTTMAVPPMPMHGVAATERVLSSDAVGLQSPPRVELQPDMYGGEPVLSGELVSAIGEPECSTSAGETSLAFAAVGLEPVTDIWHISALQDDIEHLQDMAYRLAYEMAEMMGCADCISDDRSEHSVGYAVHSIRSSAFPAFLNGLTGNDDGNEAFNLFAFTLWLTGSEKKGDSPVFNDVAVVKLMRLIRVIRRLRELQRAVSVQEGTDHVS